MGFAEVALDGDLVGKAGAGEVDPHRLAVAQLEPEALAVTEVGHGEIAAQKTRLTQIAALQQTVLFALPIVEAAVNETALAEI